MEQWMNRSGVTALAAALVMTGIASPADAQQQFNGQWSVEVVTEKGECDKAYRYPVAVQNGRVSYSGTAPFEINGRVAPTGAVQGSIVAPNNQGRADVRGQLDGKWGTGTWVARGAMNCSGRWLAEKRS
jgi:hypothetical protein